MPLPRAENLNRADDGMSPWLFRSNPAIPGFARLAAPVTLKFRCKRAVFAPQVWPSRPGGWHGGKAAHSKRSFFRTLVLSQLEAPSSTQGNRKVGVDVGAQGGACEAAPDTLQAPSALTLDEACR